MLVKRYSIVSCVAVAAVGLLALSAVADARVRHHHARSIAHPRSEPVSSNSSDSSPRFAAFVVDAKTGHVLYSKNADAPRHPASLTKMMTLYVLFEELERGRFTMSSRLKVSEHASYQNPTKLGLRPGNEIEVRDAILGLVTQSANDAAVTIAENVSGSEPAFAARMTQTARKLGMTGTLFRNASGLPNDEQITTARDMVTLGRAIQERFPENYKVFSTRSFAYHGRVFGNHNHLLGRIEGIDGIKTGYTQASGYNLVSSLRRDGRHVVAAVLGGTSGAARDAAMTRLLEQHLAEASTGPKVATIFTDAKMAARDGEEKPTAPIKIDRTPVPERQIAAVATLAPQPVAPAPLAPIKVATESISVTPVVQPIPPVAKPRPRMALAEAHSTPIDDGATAMARSILTPEQSRRAVLASNSADIPMPAPMPSIKPKSDDDQSEVVRPGRDKSSAERRKEAAEADRMVTASLEPPRPADAAKARPAPAAANRDGWVIQIGATDKVSDAKALLEKAQAKVGSRLAANTAMTEPVVKGSSTLYRARFSGFTAKTAAEAACSALKHKDFACLVLHQ